MSSGGRAHPRFCVQLPWALVTTARRNAVAVTRGRQGGPVRSHVVLPRIRLAVAAAILVALAACSVSSPKLAAGPPVTTGSGETTTTTVPVSVDSTDAPGTSG